MVELTGILKYNEAMKRSSFASIFAGAFNRLLDSLDMRHRAHPAPLQRGESVEHAWANTGAYLRKAMDTYDQETAQADPRRQTR